MAEARLPGRAASISLISAATVRPREPAIAASSSQYTGSSATLVR